jgi:signal peptidase I
MEKKMAEFKNHADDASKAKGRKDSSNGTKPRIWWVAGLLSYLVPGLGQVYNGKPARGLLFYAVLSLFGSQVFAFALNAMKFSYTSFYTALLLLSMIFYLIAILFIIGDAIYGARKNKFYRLQPYNKWPIYLLAIFLSQGIDYSAKNALKETVIKAYRIPTTSMEPAIKKGDFLLSNKLYYCSHNPQRGDIIIFKYPQNEKLEYIKRIIGLPGDTVLVKNGTTFINGRKMDEPYLQKHTSALISELRQADRDSVLQIVPRDEYFVLGDNRHNSSDSRHWGTVKREQILGKPSFVYWSWDSSISGWNIFKKLASIRWSRIGHRL